MGSQLASRQISDFFLSLPLSGEERNTEPGTPSSLFVASPMALPSWQRLGLASSRTPLRIQDDNAMNIAPTRNAAPE